MSRIILIMLSCEMKHKQLVVRVIIHVRSMFAMSDCV